VTGDEDDGQWAVGPGQLALQVEPAQSRQPDVENEAAGRVRTLAAEELLRRGERLNPQPTDSASSFVELRIDGSSSTT